MSRTPRTAGEQGLTSFDVLAVLRRSAWLLAVVTVVGAAAGLVVSAVQTTTYDATTTVLISTPQTAPSAQALYSGELLAETRAKALTTVLTSSPVLDQVISSLGLDVSERALRDRIEVKVPIQTALMQVTATDRSAKGAADLSNAVVAAFSQQLATLAKSTGAATSPTDATVTTDTVRITVVQPALEPSSPSSPHRVLLLVLGALVGLAVASAVALVLNARDDQVRTADDVAAVTDLPVLARVKSRSDGPNLSTDDETLDSLRAARTTVTRRLDAQSAKSVLVASTDPDSKSGWLAVNLAASAARSGRSVVVIDADLRSRGLDPLSQPGSGLVDVLSKLAPLETSVQRFPGSDAMFILPSGTVHGEALDLLAAPIVESTLRQLEQYVDLVVVSAPAVPSATDASVLAGSVGALVLEVPSGRVSAPSLRASVESLAQAGIEPIGVIVVDRPARPARERAERPLAASVAQPSEGLQRLVEPPATSDQPPVADPSTSAEPHASTEPAPVE